MNHRFLGFLILLAILATTCILTITHTSASIIVLEKAPPAPILEPGSITNGPTINWYCSDFKSGDASIVYTVRIFRRSGHMLDSFKETSKSEPWYWSDRLLTKKFNMVKEFVIKGDQLPTAAKPASFPVKLGALGDYTYAVTVSRLCEVDTPSRSVRIRESRPGMLTISVEP